MDNREGNEITVKDLNKQKRNNININEFMVQEREEEM